MSGFCGMLMKAIRLEGFLGMGETVKPYWLPVLGGLLIGGLIPVSEGVREVSDFCEVTLFVAACQPADLPAADSPHPDHAPASPSNIAATVSSSTATMSSTAFTAPGQR